MESNREITFMLYKICLPNCDFNQKSKQHIQICLFSVINDPASGVHVSGMPCAAGYHSRCGGFELDGGFTLKK